MNEKAFASLYKSEKVLISPKPYPQFQILQEENCFNPLIVFLRLNNSSIEISAIEENRKYFKPLTKLREAIESEDLGNVIDALYNFNYPAFAIGEGYKQCFIGFLNFYELFDKCQWFKNSNPSYYPQDLICPKEKKPANFDQFLKAGEAPTDRLKAIFDGLQYVDTNKIGGLKFENPFSQILRWKFADCAETFNNVSVCLKDDDFISKWLTERKNHSHQIALLDKPCEYCKNPFSPNSKKQIYCNNTCRNKAYRDNKALNEAKRKKDVHENLKDKN
jgi:hypothetical protein